MKINIQSKNKLINALFVPLDLAIKLRSKHFNYKCFIGFNTYSNNKFDYDEPKSWNLITPIGNIVDIPMYEQVFQWLRDKGIYIEIMSYVESNASDFVIEEGINKHIYSIIVKDKKDDEIYGSNDLYYDTYEECRIEAIKEAISKL